MVSDLNIFNYKRLSPFLEDVARQPRLIGRKRATLKAWAEKLGYQSPRSVGMIFDGRRLPSSKMLNRLCLILNLSPEERDYFFSLLALEKAKAETHEKSDLLNRIEKSNPKIENQIEISPEEFQYVSEWYHIVIKQLLQNSGNAMTSDRIKRILKGKVTDFQIEEALHNLQKLNLLTYDESTKSYQTKNESFITTQDIPSSCIRSHHRQMLQRASEALDEVELEHREFTSSTFSFAMEHMNEVKEIIRNFRDRLEKQYAAKDSQNVYQLNIQFFPHSDSSTQNEP